MHDHLVPPEDTTGIDVLEAEWKMEYDVIDGFWGDAGESIEVYYQGIDYVRRHGVNKPAREPVAV